MGLLRGIGTFTWRFMVIFSFIVNIVLVVVLLALGVLIFEIKNQVAQPLITGLHSSFVGLDEATIDWTIPVRDQIPVRLDIPLETDTVVTLTSAVPLEVNAFIDLPGLNAANVPATVRLDLPEGLELPVALDLDVEVDQPLDVELDVRAVIPLEQTQLHDVAENLRLLFEPLARGLHNLPNDFGEAGQMVRDVWEGERPDLLAENDYSRNPWPGYSRTAGVGYELVNEPVPVENLPILTGIVPLGGIPFMDQEIRPELYDLGGPEEVNTAARAEMEQLSVPQFSYTGGTGDFLMNGGVFGVPAVTQPQVMSTPSPDGSPPTTDEDSEDLGIITPVPGS